MTELESVILERLIREYTDNSFVRNSARYAAEAVMTAIDEATQEWDLLEDAINSLYCEAE